MSQIFKVSFTAAKSKMNEQSGSRRTMTDIIGVDQRNNTPYYVSFKNMGIRYSIVL